MTHAIRVFGGAKWMARCAAAGLMAATLLAPTPARASLFKPSAADQKKLGAEAAKQVEKENKLVDGARLERVQKVGNRLVAALPEKQRKSWNYGFKVIDSKEINAFALPGGPVYVYTGLLDRLTTDDEVAALLGHEIAHVYKEHWANMTADAQKRNLGLGVLLGAAKADRAWYNVAGVASSLMDLKYSRKDENQSDDEGLKTMVAAGYDPRGMLSLFQVMQNASKDGKTPEFLRSHPVTTDRIKNTEKRIAAMKK